MGAAEGIAKSCPFARVWTLSSIPLPISYANPRLDHFSTSSPTRLEARICFIYLSPKAMEHLKTGHSRGQSGKLTAWSSGALVVYFSALDGCHSSKRPTTSSTRRTRPPAPPRCQPTRILLQPVLPIKRSAKRRLAGIRGISFGRIGLKTESASLCRRTRGLNR
jgi:hypothetical protein